MVNEWSVILILIYFVIMELLGVMVFLTYKEYCLLKAVLENKENP